MRRRHRRVVQPGTMASLLIATGNGVARQSQLDPGAASVSELATQLTGLLLAASQQPGWVTRADR